MLRDLVTRCRCHKHVRSLCLRLSLNRFSWGEHHAAHRDLFERERNQILDLEWNDLREFRGIAEGKRQSPNEEVLAGEGRDNVSAAIQAIFPEEVPQRCGAASRIRFYRSPKRKGMVEILDRLASG